MRIFVVRGLSDRRVLENYTHTAIHVYRTARYRAPSLALATSAGGGPAQRRIGTLGSIPVGRSTFGRTSTAGCIQSSNMGFACRALGCVRTLTPSLGAHLVRLTARAGRLFRIPLSPFTHCQSHGERGGRGILRNRGVPWSCCMATDSGRRGVVTARFSPLPSLPPW